MIFFVMHVKYSEIAPGSRVEGDSDNVSCLWNAERYRFRGAVLVACHFAMGLCTPMARRLLLPFCALLLLPPSRMAHLQTVRPITFSIWPPYLYLWPKA